MEKVRERLLEVWREACRHIEIHQSVQNIAAIIAREMPLGSLTIARFGSDQPTVETLAEGSTGDDAAGLPSTCTLPAGRWKRLMAWARRSEIADGRGDEMSQLLGDFLPRGRVGEVLVGALVHSDSPTGLVTFVALEGAAFQAADRLLLEQLLEPLSVALENDRRLYELNSLREAAEADRRSLLSRLGRQEVNEEVVGAETGLKSVMQRVELVAKSDVPVLILGETGTGKEVVSRAIHTRSKRAGHPFIRVNCGAIPAELIDSQLFGHEKGSFTGASEQHQGWFERADGGTLFLDEIGELPLAAQVRLLRVLQDHQVERVGARQPIHVDVRIIAATHRDLASMVKQRSFREDLWYRINVFPILLPRLRERIEDIPYLARHFAQRASVRFGLSPVEPSPADLRLLSNYSWPGNIRELGAVIDRAAILGRGRTLEVATSLGLSQPLPVTPAVPDEPTFYEVIPESPRPHVLIDDSEISSLQSAMRAHIERALQSTHGQIEGKSGAAALLGINPHTLRARMRKLRIDWASFRH